MSTLASLRILLGLDAGGVKVGGSEARAEMGIIRADAQRTAASVNTAAADMGRSFNGVGASVLGLAKSFAGIAAITSAGALFADSIKGAIQEEEGISRLTASLKANVPAWDGNTAAIERTIKAREDFGFSDDELRSSLTGLIGATHDVNAALDIQNTAMDLARFRHISLAEASDALTKVEAGSFRILKGLGIELQAGATQTEALIAVQKVAAGQYEEFGRTAAGAGQAAAAAFHDAEESLGKALIPLMRGVADVVKNILAPALELVAGNLDKIGGIATGLAVALGARLVAGLTATALNFATASAAAVGFAGATGVAATAAAADAAAMTAAATQTTLFTDTALAGAPQLELFAAAELSAASGATAIATTAPAAAVSITELAVATSRLIPLLGLLAVAIQGIGKGEPEKIIADKLPEGMARTKSASADLAIAVQAAKFGLDNLGASAGTAGPPVTALGHNIAELRGASQDYVNHVNSEWLAAQKGAAGGLDVEARAALALTIHLGSLAGATEAQKQAAQNAMAAFEALGTVVDGFNSAIDKSAAASDHFGFTNRAAMDLAVGGMQGAYKTAKDLHDAILDIPTSKTVTITIQTLAESAGSRNVAERVGAANDPASANDPAVAAANSAFLNDQAARAAAAAAARKAAADAAARDAKSAADQAAREAQSARDRAAREAEQKARDSARQQASDYRDAMSAAYDKISADAHKVFDAVHAANLKIIRDAQDTANAQIEAQEKAIRGFVTGEQAKLDAERAHRRELELRADGANAVSPEDRARAQQSLNDFLADQRIAFLSAQADTQVAALDATKAANDATAAAQTQAENDRFKQQTTEFDKALKALEDGLKRHPELWKSSQENVLKLLLKYDVDYQKAGTAAGKAYADGLLAASLAVEQAARGVAVAGARAEGNIVVAPPVVPVVPTPPAPIRPPTPVVPSGPAQQSTDASYAAVTVGYSKSPAPERSVQSQITPMGEWAGGGKLGDVYLDAEKVGEFYAKRNATLDAIYNPVPVSIGPKR